MNMLLSATPVKVMSSREIAELCLKRHDNVMQVINSLISAQILTPEIQESKFEHRGNTYKMFLLNKRDSLVVVARLSPEFTAAVVDRWQQLESAQPTIPQTLPDALRLAADLAEQNARAGERLAIAEPKAAAFDAITHAPDNLCIRDTAKTLNLHQNQLVEWCMNNQWLYRDQKNTLKAYARRIEQDFLHQKINCYVTKSGEDRISVQVKFTPKGISHLAKIFGVAL